MQPFNIYLCGVGGQGIGLLCEILLRAADYAGYTAKAVDTHGLAQRGGSVVSHIRLGDRVHSPLIPAGKADLVIGLERHEALRGAQATLRDGGTLLYYDTVLQPLGVRLGTIMETSHADITDECNRRRCQVHPVFWPALKDPRAQNIAVLATLDKFALVPDLNQAHLLKAMDDLMSGSMLTDNLVLFHQVAAA
ncbi:MAG: 2-oxoacid:acceptor oxidoreductase family protein [Desulfobulbus sp.]|nr:2-oxoacid:acceptor oxidoreductase family protein [Desulfobulbus sp.]